MELEFKKDFEQARERWSEFWRGESKRPLLRICLPKKNAGPAQGVPHPYLCANGDLDKIIDQVLAGISACDWLFEAIPAYQITFAPDHFSALLGADLKFHPDSPETVWTVPFVKDWDDVEIKFRPDGRWWNRTVEAIRKFRRRCDDRLIIVGPNLQGGLDCLSAIRGVNELLLDIIDSPGKIKKALDAVNLAIIDVRKALAEELNINKYGSRTRHSMYSTGFLDVPQCDFSAMISPEMFREFALPSLADEVKLLDAAEYHLDGPDAIKHLEAISEIKKISVIQWQPGAGQAASQDWTHLYKKIDSLGLGQVIGADHETIKRMWREFNSRKLFFSTSVSSHEEARRLAAELEKAEKQ